MSKYEMKTYFMIFITVVKSKQIFAIRRTIYLNYLAVITTQVTQLILLEH